MHELSIALRLVELVEEQVRNEPAETTVNAVDIRVGELSSIVPDALHFAWGPATDGTRLEGATLRITPVAGSDALELAAVELSDLPLP